MSKPEILAPEVITKKSELWSYLDFLGINSSEISDDAVFLTAFVHKSYAADFKENYTHNERLEFVWDAVLGAVIAQKLYQDFPEIPEAIMTLYKIALVREESLAKVAKKIWLPKYLFISKGEENNGGREKAAIISDAFEAIVGAIFLELGYEQVRKFILTHLYPELQEIKKNPTKSYKSLSQELVQKTHKQLPEYINTIAEQDEKNNPLLYKSEFLVQESCKAIGYGSNKKKAEEDAAKNYYEQHQDS